MTAASWLKRAFAWLIDMHISMLFLVLAYVGSLAAFHRFDRAVAIGLTIVMFNIWWWIGFYNRCYLMGRRGHSWGRQFVHINLISEKTGKPIGVFRAFIRENNHFADWLLLGFGFLLPIWDGKRQTVADKVMHTVTVEGDVPNRPFIPAGAAVPAETPAEHPKPAVVQ